MKTLSKCLFPVLWCVAGALLWSCDTTPRSNIESTTSIAPVEISDNETDNIALVHKFLEAQMTGDGLTMANLVTPDFYAINPAGDSLAIDVYVDIWTALSKSRSNQDAGVFATNSQSVKDGPLAGEWVLFWGTYTATEIETSEALEILWHADFEIINGKIKRSVSYFNMVDPKVAA